MTCGDQSYDFPGNYLRDNMEFLEMQRFYNDICLINDLGEKISELFKFEKVAVSLNETWALDFLYEKLNFREDWDVYLRCRLALKKRSDSEEFLLEKIKSEKSPRIIGDILHILGGKRSTQALPVVRKFLSHEDDYIREVCLYVIGWVGKEVDLTLLADKSLFDPCLKNRCIAVTALRQIYFRSQDLKQKIIHILEKIFEENSDELVASWIVIVVSSISGMNFGLKEKPDDPYGIVGDAGSAKSKVAAYFSSL